MPLETPMGLSLIFCDMIIEDKTTGKKSLIGLFDRIHTRTFPCIHTSMALFVSMTSGQGRYPCEVVCRHTDDKTIAFRVQGHVGMKDPTQVVDIIFRLNGVRFPLPGVYWVHFLVDGMPIMMRPLTLNEVEHPPAPPNQSGSAQRN